MSRNFLTENRVFPKKIEIFRIQIFELKQQLEQGYVRYHSDLDNAQNKIAIEKERVKELEE